MKNIIYIICFFLTISLSAQIRIANSTINSSAAASSGFIDGSSSTALNSTTNQGKGIVFPGVDLTTFTAFGGAGIGIPNNYPGRYDGFIVYNIAETGVAGVGSTDGTLTKGFWYYDNPTATGGAPNPALVNVGTWRPLVGGSDSKSEVVSNTINNTTTVINGVPEKVVLVPATANGTTTELVLNAGAIISGGPLNVTKLREAKVYLGNDLLMIASGDYDNATNTLVTGDGMVNKLLRDEGADAYLVELYFE
jgi:predicted secreted protein